MVRKLIAMSLGLLILMPQAVASTSINVFAASSLTESFTQLGKRFETLYPRFKVKFIFQASSTLETQIKAGAPADIFVSADSFPGGTNFISNRVVLAVPKSSKIDKITDLNEKVIWIQCAHEVPCGQLADRALLGEGVVSKPASLEPKASSTLAKLLAKEVDAAIVYRTDVIANSKQLRAIEFKDLAAATTTYQIAQLRKSAVVSTFMAYLQSKDALKILKSKGFIS